MCLSGGAKTFPDLREWGPCRMLKQPDSASGRRRGPMFQALFSFSRLALKMLVGG